MFRYAPDAVWESPRRALIYTFDTQNPLRYVDPDGLSAVSEFLDRVAPQLGFEPTDLGPVGRAAEGALTFVVNRLPPVAIANTVESLMSGGPSALDRGAFRPGSSNPSSAANPDNPSFAAKANPTPNAGAGPGGSTGKPGSRATFAADDAAGNGAVIPLPPPPAKVKAKDRRAAEQARSKKEKHGDEDYQEPASEDYARYRAGRAEKSGGKDARRRGHDAKAPGEGDRSKQQIDDDYDE
jgi:hypothetical protein